MFSIRDRQYCIFVIMVIIFALGAIEAAVSQTWRGLVVTPEHRCSPYKKTDYRHPPSIEADIANQLGAIYGVYTGTCFDSATQTDIEHIVATSEAHDSGLCAQSQAVRRRFARDIRNLVLASPRVNRWQKSGKDASEWVPERNQCWFAHRVVEIRRAYNLTIDRREAAALERILRHCETSQLEPMVCHFQASETPRHPSNSPEEMLKLYDDNRNGHITCKEARRHGIAPVPRSHPAYRFMRDGDGDGIVCE